MSSPSVVLSKNAQGGIEFPERCRRARPGNKQSQNDGTEALTSGRIDPPTCGVAEFVSLVA